MSVTLLYGLFVTTHSLVIAAEAHEPLQPGFLALDLIALRRQRDTVYTRQGLRGAVSEVPEEVWDLVRIEMIAEELLQTERELLRSVQRSCRLCGDFGCSKRDQWFTGAKPPCDCQECHTGLKDVVRVLEAGKNVETLILAHGLRWPLPTAPATLSDFAEDGRMFILSLPFSTTGGTEDRSAPTAPPAGGSLTVITLLPVKALAAIDSATNRQRFASLIKTRNLRPLHTQLERVVDPPPGASKPFAGGAGGAKQAPSSVIRADEPRWMVW